MILKSILSKCFLIHNKAQEHKNPGSVWVKNAKKKERDLQGKTPKKNLLKQKLKKLEKSKENQPRDKIVNKKDKQMMTLPILKKKKKLSLSFQPY